ncbi:MAG: TonB-dependent receptor plug domain-containing protein [Archangium sp.]|nr:TonB-dependent receptor plug domain-containing protein [Archangium sp.]MDP3574118.1 TonB-dependent receptor plug domain-containing protein [Archangium sp.]
MSVSRTRALSSRGFSLVVMLFAGAAQAEGDVVPPEVITRVEAALPANAPPPTQDHVLLEFTVGADGVPSDILVVESAGPKWDQASSDALSKWRFKAATHEGAPVAARTRLEFKMPVELMVTPDAGTREPTDGGPAITLDDADAGHPRHELSTTVLGRGIPKSRGASDFVIEVGALQAVPRKSAADFLKLAPGILLTNEGGEGHPDRIFLRGFDAREGQDLELSVDGVPINDSGNLHGNGYADVGFIIPELVENLRVLEGPLDPRQGNYAVAGSADYQLGLSERGLLMKASYGSFETMRILGLWGPPGESSRTFGGVQLFRTSGFGQNREAQNAKLMGQYEGRLSDTTSFRVGAFGYAATFRSAGVLRADDVSRGTVGFFDSYDARQGGDALRAQVHLDLHGHGGAFSHDQTVFLLYRSTRILENFTGFLADAQLAQQNPHAQRGDLLDRDTTTFTVGARGAARWRTKIFERTQELEVGYFGRFDVARGLQTRQLAGSNTPYARDYDLDSKLSDLGAYADLNLSFTRWLTLRGGLRGELLTYDVLDLCAQKEVRRPSTKNPPGDESCLSQRDLGLYRDPTERNSASGGALMPRATLLVGPFAGVTFSAAAGTGIRSIDPQFITENLKTPFASIFSWEGGATWAQRWETLDANVRAVVFGTRVDKDLVFNAQEGRGVIGGSTSRLGGLLAARVRGSFYDLSGNVTYVQSKFDDTNLLVPYVPDFVGRLDASAFHAIPKLEPVGSPVKGRVGLGVTYVGRRALPLGQRSDVIFVVDASAELAWKALSLGVSATNLLDNRYKQVELNYASDFHTGGSLPSLVPALHFAAGAPRAVMVTLGVHLGGEP